MRIVRRMPWVMLPVGSLVSLAARRPTGPPEPPPGTGLPRPDPSR